MVAGERVTINTVCCQFVGEKLACGQCERWCNCIAGSEKPVVI